MYVQSYEIALCADGNPGYRVGFLRNAADGNDDHNGTIYLYDSGTVSADGYVDDRDDSDAGRTDDDNNNDRRVAYGLGT